MNTENPLYFTIKPISFPLPTPIFFYSNISLIDDAYARIVALD